jgi:two-component system, cell cycle response regulator
MCGQASVDPLDSRCNDRKLHLLVDPFPPSWGEKTRGSRYTSIRTKKVQGGLHHKAHPLKFQGKRSETLLCFTDNMDKRATILIVDDEPFNVDTLEQELADLGYATISAANGRAALAQVAATNPDLILLDIMMPEMDGFEVLRQLKAGDSYRDIPVVVISALSDLGNVVKGIKLGAEDYLPKPFNEVLLRARIEAGLAKKRWRDQEVAYLHQVARLTDAAAAIEAQQFDPESLSEVAARTDGLGQLTRLFQQMVRDYHRREQQLKREVRELRIEVDKTRQAQQVGKITGTDYFQGLRGTAGELRKLLEGGEES